VLRRDLLCGRSLRVRRSSRNQWQATRSHGCIVNSLQNQSCSTVHGGCEIPKETTKGKRDTRAFRAKQRAQMALRLALKTGQALTDVAISTGSSGQAPMTHASAP